MRGLNLVKGTVEVAGSLAGLFWLFAPDSLREIPQGITIVLLVLLSILGVFGAVVVAVIVRSQLEPPYSG
jgi:hypothetical protein